MKLSELQFTARDFSKRTNDPENLLWLETAGPALAELANRILREKLEKAPKVFRTETAEDPNGEWWNHLAEGDTHTAKLVCIEELKK